MELKLTRPLVFFDIESTGLDTFDDRIVELAMVKMGDGEDQSFEMRFNPGIPIKPDATDTHGITDADVAQCPSFGEFASEVAAFFRGCDVAGFNIRTFDLPMLMNELARSKEGLDFPIRVVDACDIFHQMNPRDLEAAVAHYAPHFIDEHKQHAAMGDVRATIEVLGAQLLVHDLPTTVEELHDQFIDPDAVDIGGKLKRDGEKIVLTFGKHKGTPLDALPLSYLTWMQKNNVIGPDALHHLKTALSKGYRMKHARGRRY